MGRTERPQQSGHSIPPLSSRAPDGDHSVAIYDFCVCSYYREKIHVEQNIKTSGLPREGLVVKNKKKSCQCRRYKRQEMWVQSLSREDPLEEGMATHSSILAWRIQRTEEPGRLESTGS